MSVQPDQACGDYVYAGMSTLPYTRTGLVPELRNLPPAIHENFSEIVLKGILAPGGVGKFDDVLTDTECRCDPCLPD
jgi:hypothetical protein